MKHSILIIDDEEIGARNLYEYLDREIGPSEVTFEFTEDSIRKAISNNYYNIAIVDLRMDKFDNNGIDFIKQIIAINPFASIIIISAFADDFSDDINSLFQSGKIKAIIKKEDFKTFSVKVKDQVERSQEDFENKLNLNQGALADIYSDAKNEKDINVKGKKFENFVSLLFSHIGFNHISRRVIDKSRNEIDLVVRNDIDDLFFQKFSPYFFIECKNTSDNVDKNMFIVFKEKIDKSNNLANLGFIISARGFKRTAYLEALRTSGSNNKIVFISNVEIEKLITSRIPLEALKGIIDEQVKDN